MTVRCENIRKEIVDIGIKMLKSKLIVGTWGNVSARIPDENMLAITPSGVDYDKIESRDIVIMDFHGNIVDGEKKPSSEYNLHLEIYKARVDVNAVIHTHSEYCTAMAVARKPIPGAIEDLVQIVGGEVRVSEYKLPGTKELGVAVVEALKDRSAAILANHGCVGAGRNLEEALRTVAVVEKSAKAIIFAQLLGGVVELPQEDINIMRSNYLNSYGQR